jgi:uncharacterized membrane protein
MVTRRLNHLSILVVLLVGTALRLFRLGADSLWYDETVSTYLAGSPLPELIRHTAGDIHPPLYYALLRGWLVLMGYPTGHADPTGSGLEFATGFFSLLFGVLLMTLVYALARRVADRRVASVAAALVALSPYNVWYSQEVRMYTLGAALGAVVLYALLRAIDAGHALPPGAEAARLAAPGRLKPAGGAASWWLVYALASAAGLYSLYYFAFLLVPLNLWALWRVATKDQRRRTDDRRPQTADRRSAPPGSKSAIRAPQSAIRFAPLVLADLAIVLLYLPWLPVALKQITNPPVPPWRTAASLLNVLVESWTALSLGQSAPGWLWPVLVLMLGMYGWGAVSHQLSVVSRPSSVSRQPSAVSGQRSAVSGLAIATFGPLALILLVSLITPLYHVRYLFIYSPAFYVVAAAGVIWVWEQRRPAAAALAVCWLAAAAVTLQAFWFDPAYKADDHRAAVHELRREWRPGDVVLVNAGYAYPPLYTYWDGPIASRTRLTDSLPAPRRDDALVMVTTGHVDGELGLGWGDPRSDFFALPSDVAQRQIAALLETHDRIWHYRIYDTVNDPNGRLRAALDEHGRLIDERVYPGEAFMRLQAFAPQRGASWDPGGHSYSYAAGLSVQAGPTPSAVASGEIVSGALIWRVDGPSAQDIATSLRLVGPDGETWAQPRDERPLGPLFAASQWPAQSVQRQPYAVAIPEGTPPGRYTLALLVYDPTSGAPWPPLDYTERLIAVQDGLNLGTVEVNRPAQLPALRPSLARFGPLSLVKADSPATVVSPGGSVPLSLLWQAIETPDEPLVVVAQLLGAGDQVAANLEEEPTHGFYPTQAWTYGELVRDRHTLALPAELPGGAYRLIVGVYRAADRARFAASGEGQGSSPYYVVKPLIVR